MLRNIAVSDGTLSCSKGCLWHPNWADWGLHKQDMVLGG